MFDASLVYIIRKNRKPETPGQRLVSDVTAKYHYIIELDFEQALETDLSRAIMLVIDEAPDNYETVRTLKKILDGPREKDIPFMFILGAMSRREIIQAQTIGASDFVAHPIDRAEFVEKLSAIANDSIESAWKDLSKTQEAALRASLKVFEDVFENVRAGQAFSNQEVRKSCDLTIKATEDHGIVDLMNAIRTHHNYTYRHSMMVSGYLAAFGLLLGISGQELQNLVACGLLHDIGKAKIPQEILNKPDLLTEEEWVEMKSHPEHSREILTTHDCHEDVKDGCIHHHEKLDGTGYPDQLKGDEIGDMARMVAIADIFSGLTEKRAYKSSMSNHEAYEKMLTMEGHIDMPLLKSFKPIAINS